MYILIRGTGSWVEAYLCWDANAKSEIGNEKSEIRFCILDNDVGPRLARTGCPGRGLGSTFRSLKTRWKAWRTPRSRSARWSPEAESSRGITRVLGVRHTAMHAAVNRGSVVFQQLWDMLHCYKCGIFFLRIDQVTCLVHPLELWHRKRFELVLQQWSQESKYHRTRLNYPTYKQPHEEVVPINHLSLCQ